VALEEGWGFTPWRILKSIRKLEQKWLTAASLTVNKLKSKKAENIVIILADKPVERARISTISMEGTRNEAIERGRKTIKKLWFKTAKTRGDINKGNVRQHRATFKIGFAAESCAK
jgi:flavin-binding protein dodecin